MAAEDAVSVRGAVSDAVAALGRDPALAPLVAIAILPLVSLAAVPLAAVAHQRVFLPDGSLIAILLLWPLVAPPVLGGVFAILDEVTDDEPLRVDAFVEGALGNARGLFEVQVAVYAGVAVLAIALGILAVLPVVSALLVIASPLVALFLLYLAMYVQFVTVGAVVDDEPALLTFDRCRGILHGHARNILVYSLLRVAVPAAVLVTVYVLLTGPLSLHDWYVAVPFDWSGFRIGMPAIGVLVVGWLSSVLLVAVHVTYYKRLARAYDSRDGDVRAPPAARNPQLGKPATAVADAETDDS